MVNIKFFEFRFTAQVRLTPFLLGQVAIVIRVCQKELYPLAFKPKRLLYIFQRFVEMPEPCLFYLWLQSRLLIKSRGKQSGLLVVNCFHFNHQKNLKNLEISSGQWSPNNYMASHRLFSHPWLPVAHQSPRQLQQPLAAVCENWARIISL